METVEYVCSGLPPWEASVMIADKAQTLFLLSMSHTLYVTHTVMSQKPRIV